MRKRDIKLTTLEWYRDAQMLHKYEKWNKYVKGVAEAYRNILQTMGFTYKDLTNKDFVDNKIKELREDKNVRDKSKS